MHVLYMMYADIHWVSFQCNLPDFWQYGGNCESTSASIAWLVDTIFEGTWQTLQALATVQRKVSFHDSVSLVCLSVHCLIFRFIWHSYQQCHCHQRLQKEQQSRNWIQTAKNIAKISHRIVMRLLPKCFLPTSYSWRAQHNAINGTWPEVTLRVHASLETNLT